MQKPNTKNNNLRQLYDEYKSFKQFVQLTQQTATTDPVVGDKENQVPNHKLALKAPVRRTNGAAVANTNAKKKSLAISENDSYYLEIADECKNKQISDGGSSGVFKEICNDLQNHPKIKNATTTKKISSLPKLGGVTKNRSCRDNDFEIEDYVKNDSLIDSNDSLIKEYMNNNKSYASALSDKLKKQEEDNLRLSAHSFRPLEPEGKQLPVVQEDVMESAQLKSALCFLQKDANTVDLLKKIVDELTDVQRQPLEKHLGINNHHQLRKQEDEIDQYKVIVQEFKAEREKLLQQNKQNILHIQNLEKQIVNLKKIIDGAEEQMKKLESEKLINEEFESKFDKASSREKTDLDALGAIEDYEIKAIRKPYDANNSRGQRMNRKNFGAKNEFNEGGQLGRGSWGDWQEYNPNTSSQSQEHRSSGELNNRSRSEKRTQSKVFNYDTRPNTLFNNDGGRFEDQSKPKDGKRERTYGAEANDQIKPKKEIQYNAIDTEDDYIVSLVSNVKENKTVTSDQEREQMISESAHSNGKAKTPGSHDSQHHSSSASYSHKSRTSRQSQNAPPSNKSRKYYNFANVQNPHDFQKFSQSSIQLNNTKVNNSQMSQSQKSHQIQKSQKSGFKNEDAAVRHFLQQSMDIAQLQVDESTIQIDSSVVDDFIMTDRSQNVLREEQIDVEAKPVLMQRERDPSLSDCKSNTQANDAAVEQIISESQDGSSNSQLVDVQDQEAQILEDAPEEAEQQIQQVPEQKTQSHHSPEPIQIPQVRAEITTTPKDAPEDQMPASIVTIYLNIRRCLKDNDVDGLTEQIFEAEVADIPELEDDGNKNIQDFIDLQWYEQKAAALIEEKLSLARV